jgi:hypothetical protein
MRWVPITRRDSPEVLTSPVAFLETTLREELARSHRPDLKSIATEQIAIEPLLDTNSVFRIAAHEGDTLGLRPIQFKRYRQKRGDSGENRRSGFFRLIFPERVGAALLLLVTPLISVSAYSCRSDLSFAQSTILSARKHRKCVQTQSRKWRSFGYRLFLGIMHRRG